MTAFILGAAAGLIAHRVGYWQGRRAGTRDASRRPLIRPDSPGRWF